MIRVFGSIESAFNNIWEVKVERSITRQWTDYIAVVMIVPILWIVANAVGKYAQDLVGFDDNWCFRTAVAAGLDDRDLGDVHLPLHHHPQRQGPLRQRPDGRHRRRNHLPAVPMGAMSTSSGG